MNLSNLENIYTDINKEIDKIATDIKNNQDKKKVKELDQKLNILTQCSRPIGKLLNYYKFN